MSAPTLRSVVVNDTELAYLEQGSGPLAMCLHGFPDTAHSWRFLLDDLADGGFRAVAPFQRGYAPSAVPADGRYQTGVLAMDAIALHEALGGGDDAVVIGHDWGAMAATGAAVHAPDRWRRIVTMAVPPGPAAGAALLGDLGQLKRSWYMFFFQSPLADMIVPANDLAFIDMLWSDWSPGYDGAADAARVKDALGDPAHLAAALGYYRATLGAGYVDPGLADVQAACFAIPTQPMLYIHGRTDGCMGVEIVDAARASSPPNVRWEVVDRAGHFLQVEQPAAVNALVLEHLR